MPAPAGPCPCCVAVLPSSRASPAWRLRLGEPRRLRGCRRASCSRGSELQGWGKVKSSQPRSRQPRSRQLQACRRLQPRPSREPWESCRATSPWQVRWASSMPSSRPSWATAVTGANSRLKPSSSLTSTSRSRTRSSGPTKTCPSLAARQTRKSNPRVSCQICCSADKIGQSCVLQSACLNFPSRRLFLFSPARLRAADAGEEGHAAARHRT